MIGKLEEGRTSRHQCSCRVRINKVSFRALGKRIQTTCTAVRKGEKFGQQSASAYLPRKPVQQQVDKCSGLLWPDAFTKGGLFTAVLNAAPAERWPPKPPFTVGQRAQN
ncbi:hypothetical protein TNIN_80971 [Trichonephila inaurata madagascariensis]|uniref:Uncharacterized protein n=1 Tax=Trichonephila inaurata madagascariensis TaxID=2747483 RepID=A0A8X6X671_9ARAC|nr:hypothetical protein TNIN_80971 [Trichonephila inaurata madagascariensis]